MSRKSKEKQITPFGDIEEVETTHTLVIDSGKLEQLNDYLKNRAERPEVIREATIVDGSKLNVKWTVEIPNGVDTTTKKCSAPVHDDLRNAFAKLHEHLGKLCDQPITEHNPAYKNDKTLPAMICPIHCNGFKLSGNEESESVVLFGSRTLPNAKTIDLQSPPQKWNGDIFDYEDIGGLQDIIEQCTGEVEMYLFDGKHAPDIQGSLFPDSESEDEDDLPE